MTRIINSLLTNCNANCLRRDVWLVALLLFIGTVLFLGTTQPAVGQEVIVHSGFTFDDGDPAKDGDGTKNGVVVWKGAAIHVTQAGYSFGEYTNETLIIQAGAIVKVDANGIYAGNKGALQIEGATLTDFRDDAVGGDTNRDGNNTSPSPSYVLRFSGTERDYIKNSTLKYVRKMGHTGSMKITDNKFLMFWYFSSSGGQIPTTEPPVLDAVPVISGNTFEFAGMGSLELQGMNPVVENNIFRYTPGISPAGVPSAATILLGPVMSYRESPPYAQQAGPQSGGAYISNNVFETANGIEIWGVDEWFVQSRFRADIRNNKMRGTGVSLLGGRGNFGLKLAFAAQAVILSNDVSNYREPIKISPPTVSDRFGASGLVINNNRFSLDSAASGPDSISYRYWRNGIFVNAENNFWGDPTGPFDNSNADGLYNPRGKGLKIGNGIDYVPFIGGAPPPPKDAIHITASSIPSAPLTPDATVTINVAVDYYQLQSAPAGKIVVILRDDEGFILNNPGTSVNVTSQNQTASIPPIQYKVPELSGVVTVEAALVPDGEGESAISNVELFVVNRPQSSFSITSITEAGALLPIPPIPIRGNKTKLNVEISYTLSTPGNGRFEVEMIERDKTTGQTFPIPFSPTSFDVPSGTNKTVTQEVEVEIPLRDVLPTPPNGELYGKITFKDATGKVIGKQDGAIPIIEAGNEVNIIAVVPGKDTGGSQINPAGRSHFLVGEKHNAIIDFEVRVNTTGVTNWQIQEEAKALDPQGRVLQTYTLQVPLVYPVTTMSKKKFMRIVSGLTPIPPGTRIYREYLKLAAPDMNITVAVASRDVEVRDAEQAVQKAVPAGASQVAFNPIPATLNFSSNRTAGITTAEQFAGQFGAPAATANLLMKTNAFYWKFIPLNKYWSVYDTLKDGTFSATISFTYNPATDFPAVSGFNEDSLVITGLNPLSGELEALPTTLNKTTRTVTTKYDKFFDTWVVASKQTVVVSVKSDMSMIPERFVLEQNYPNPFNPSTTIQFQIPVSTTVEINIYNTLGQKVRTLVNRRYRAGIHSINWDGLDDTGRQTASGIYLYIMKSNDYMDIKKLIFLK